MNGKIYVKEIIYNALVFIPLGIYLQYLMANKSIWKKIGVGALVSLSFETLQYVFAIGGSDIADLMSNTMGVILGLGLYKLIEKMFENNLIKVINTIDLLIEFCGVSIILFLNYVNG